MVFRWLDTDAITSAITRGVCWQVKGRDAARLAHQVGHSSRAKVITLSSQLGNFYVGVIDRTLCRGLMKDLTAHQMVVRSVRSDARSFASGDDPMNDPQKIITDEEGREICGLLESSQAAYSSPDVFEAARELIEQHPRKFLYHEA